MGLIKFARKIGGKITAKVGGVIKKPVASGLGAKKASTGVMQSAKKVGIKTLAVKGAKKVALRVAGAGAAATIGTGALVAGGLYAAEQVAEKLGVRGGAGFIGKRKRRKSRRYVNIRVPRNRRGEGRITLAEERSLRRQAIRASYSEGTTRRRSSRRSKSKYRSAAWMRKIRKMRK